MALIYCPECGKQVSDSAATCPGCGYPISSLNMAGKTNYRTAESMAEDYSKPDDGKYNVFLTSALEEGVSATARILSDVLGYTYSDALALATSLPTIVLYNVTVNQAKAAANALADYGLDVAVYDQNGYVDFTDYAYDAEKYTTTANGTSVANGLWEVLKTLTVANLISRVSMRRYSYPFPYSTWLRVPKRKRFFFNPLYPYGYGRRPSLAEQLLGLNRGRYNNYRYEPPRTVFRSYYRTPPRPAQPPRPNGNRPPVSGGSQRPSSGGLFQSLFGSSAPSGGGRTVGGTSKPGMGHTSSGSRSTFGTGSSGRTSGSTFGSSKGSSSGSSFGSSRGSSSGFSFGSSRPGGMGHSSGSSRSAGSTRSSGSSFGGSRSGSMGHSSGFSSGSRSSGSSFGGGRMGGSSKGGMGHGKKA